MIFRNGNINDLLESASGKKLVCYGIGKELEFLCEAFAPYGLLGRIDYVTGGTVESGAVPVNGTEKPFISLERLLDIGADIVLLVSEITGLNDITSIIMSDVYEKLRDTVFYAGGFLLHNPPGYSLPQHEPNAAQLIPKTLHYCWFGRNPLPPIMKKCVDSWEKFCPDYEIVEWNEDNYDVNQNSFIREAYKAKKWAFVSDFARMDVVYRYGGIYMDTDVELIKPMDRFLNDAAFCGMEAASVPALSLPFGAAAGNELIGGLRDLYKRIPFLKANGEYNLTPCTHYHAMMFRGLGLTKENRIQHVKGFSVYPTDVFSPAHPALVYECFTGNTHAIHHYAASWRADAENEDKLDVAARYREIMDGMHKGNLYKVPISR